MHYFQHFKRVRDIICVSFRFSLSRLDALWLPESTNTMSRYVKYVKCTSLTAWVRQIFRLISSFSTVPNPEIQCQLVNSDVKTVKTVKILCLGQWRTLTVSPPDTPASASLPAPGTKNLDTRSPPRQRSASKIRKSAQLGSSLHHRRWSRHIASLHHYIHSLPDAPPGWPDEGSPLQNRIKAWLKYVGNMLEICWKYVQNVQDMARWSLVKLLWFYKQKPRRIRAPSWVEAAHRSISCGIWLDEFPPRIHVSYLSPYCNPAHL